MTETKLKKDTLGLDTASEAEPCSFLGELLSGALSYHGAKNDPADQHRFYTLQPIEQAHQNQIKDVSYLDVPYAFFVLPF